jgi:AcrR family transcriptional regulator
MSEPTAFRILAAARSGLLADGYVGLSTRRVAELAGVPLSQIHYHFGGKQGLLLSVLAHENERLVERQRQLYAEDLPLWRRYEVACDLLEEDLASGYVRVLQEMIAAGWSDAEIALPVLGLVRSWFEVLTEVAGEAERRFGPLGPVAATDLAGLIGLAFLGAETMILLDDPAWSARIKGWLRSLVALIREREEA